MIQHFARGVSILGHPILLLPLAALALMAAREASPERLLTAAAVFAGLGSALLLWSRRQVARDRWTHIDASAPAERRSLNRAVLAMLLLSAGIAWWRGAATVTLGATLAAAMVLAAMVLARRCTLSLHLSFAMFSAGIAWAAAPALGVAVAGMAIGVGWSRLYLARHTARDLIAGAAVGAIAALAFVSAAPSPGAAA